MIGALAMTMLLSAQSLTPMSTTIGVKVGPYRPNIDAELGGATPYRDLFEDDHGIFVVPQLRLLREVGAFTFGAAASVGYVKLSATAFLDDGVDGGPASGDVLSGGETSIRVVPIALLGVVRLSRLPDWIDFPLVPYAEVGPAYALWRIAKGDDETAASGGSLGWQVNAGISLRLDGFDPAAAKSLFDQFSVTGTELTFEWSHLSMDGFGRDGTLRVGDSTWTLGLAIGF